MALTKPDLYTIVTNNGYDENGVRFSIQDALATPDTPQMLGQIYTEVLQELIQLQLVGQRLIQNFQISLPTYVSGRFFERNKLW